MGGKTKGGKTKKIVPKRIGSVKVPKRLRKTLNKALAHPKTAEIATGALLAAATALARRGLDHGTGTHGRYDERNRPGAAKSHRAAGGSSSAGDRSTANDLGDIGHMVADAAGEAVRGVAASLTRLVGETVEGLRRDRNHDDPDDGGSRPSSARSTRPANGSASEEPGPKTGEGDEFGDHDDNDDPVDGNDENKPGPMTGTGP